jgi:predicted RNase H-like HicB family nuclease
MALLMLRYVSKIGEAMDFEIVFDREDDGRWIAEIASLPGVLAYGQTRLEAQSKVEALALRVIADQIESEQSAPKQVRFAIA